MTVSCHILLGGIWGWDGWGTSRGMLGLQRQLDQLPGVKTTVRTWNKFQTVVADMGAGPQVVIGYSGGGSRSTYLAGKPIDLLIAYDPSPAGQCRPLGANVRHAICYHNLKPAMWWPGIGKIGGGQLTAAASNKYTQIDTIPIAQQHLLVQYNKQLHVTTLQAVEQLVRSAKENAL